MFVLVRITYVLTIHNFMAHFPFIVSSILLNYIILALLPLAVPARWSWWAIADFRGYLTQMLSGFDACVTIWLVKKLVISFLHGFTMRFLISLVSSLQILILLLKAFQLWIEFTIRLSQHLNLCFQSHYFLLVRHDLSLWCSLLLFQSFNGHVLALTLTQNALYVWLKRMYFDCKLLFLLNRSLSNSGLVVHTLELLFQIQIIVFNSLEFF